MLIVRTMGYYTNGFLQNFNNTVYVLAGTALNYWAIS
jgi:hypothetical protein